VQIAIIFHNFLGRMFSPKKQDGQKYRLYTVDNSNVQCTIVLNDYITRHSSQKQSPTHTPESIPDQNIDLSPSSQLSYKNTTKKQQSFISLVFKT